MITKLKCCYATATLMAALWYPVTAAGAPAAAMNKTITISFVATGMSKRTDGTTRGFNTTVSRMIYVSSAGRLFMRHTLTSGRASRGGDFDPNDARTGKGSFQFRGNKLVGVIPFSSGARQITATFDPGFSSCTATVIEGHSGGVIRRRGPDGAMYEVTSGSTTSVTCSIQNGNAFAN